LKKKGSPEEAKLYSHTENLHMHFLWVDCISVFFKWWFRFSFCLSIHSSLLAIFF